MSNFSAEIQAKLNTNGITEGINDIENRQINFKNISFNTNKLISDIQSALNNNRFTINLDRVNMSSITNQMQRSGSDAGRNFSSAFSSTLNNIHLKNGGINNLKKMLQGAGFDNPSISSITQELDKMVLTVNKLSTRQFNNGNIRMTITGVDELNRTVQIVRDFNKETGKVSNTTKTFVQSFGTSASGISKFNRTVEQANSAIKNNDMTASIAKVSAQYEQLSTSGHQSLSTINSDISELKRLQSAVNNSTNNESLVSNYNAFNNQLKKVKNNLTTIKAETSKTSTTINKLNVSARDAGTALKTGYIDSSIKEAKAKYEQLATTGHNSLSKISTDIQHLNQLQSKMVNESDSIKLGKMYDEFNITLLRVKNNLSSVAAESKTFVNVLQISTLDNKIASWMQKNSKASRDFGASINNLRRRLASLNASGTATTSELNAIEKEFNEVRQAAIATGQVGSSIGNQLKRGFSSILRYVSISTVIYQSTNAFREMYQNVYNIDKQMTELKKVTDETAVSYSNFLKNAGSTAKKIGTTMSDFISSTTDFARLGYSFADSQELAKVANIYSVVGDEIDNIDTATKSIISTMTAFSSQIDSTISQSEFALSIIDKINEVSNNYAISSGGIGDALERSASSMAAANNTLDETIALITAANTVVQDPDAVGTAFKTISMRIRGAKTELEEAGLETDGMVESTARLRKEIMALSGVDIMKDKNTFKSTYDIIDELSKKWQELTDIQQASITELIAGKRQGNIISSLMENFDIARKALQTSLDSEGSAISEHEKWMESIEAKILQLKAAWEELSQAFLEDSFLKRLVDTGTIVLSTLTQIIDAFGTLPTLLTVIAGIMSFKDVGMFKNIEKEGNTFVQNLKSIFLNGFNGIFASFRKQDFSFTNTFSTTLEQDRTALLAYRDAINNNIPSTDAFKQTMTSASVAAQEFAKNNEVNILGIQNFTKSQKTSAIEIMAQNKSFAKCRTLINEYSNGCKNCGLSQEQFTTAVGKSNPALAKYLSGLNGAKGSLVGYIASLVSSKAATIGLKVATMALNMGFTALISYGINLVIDAFQRWQRQQQETIDKTYEAAKSLDEEKSSIEDYKKKILELRTALDDNNISQSAAQSKREELMTIQDELIDKYGKEKDSINNITDAINGQIDALDKLSEKKVEDWGKQNSKGMSSAEKYWTEDITDYITTNDDQYLYSFSADGKNRQKILKSTGIDINQNVARIQQGDKFYNYSIKASNRKDLIDKLNKLYDEVQNYGKTEYSLSDEEISNILTDISNTINYYNDQNAEDGNYNKQKLNAEKSALYKIFTVKNDNGDLKYKSLYDNINQAKEQYQKALESKNYNEVQAAKKAYEEVIQEIIDNTGEGKIIDDTTESGENIKMYFDSLNEEMQNIADGYKFIIKVNPDNIKSIINQSSKGSEQKTITKEDLDNLYLADIGENGLSRTETSMLDYSQEYIAAYNQIVQSAQDAGISVKDFIQELVNGGYLAENSASSYSSVSDIFTTYSDEITAVTSKAGKLKSAYSNLLKGSLSDPSDVIALVQEFPKLASYVDLADSNFGNLAQGIQDISGEIADGLIQKLKDIDKSTLTEDEIKAYELLEEYLKNIGIQAQESLIWLQKIQSTISSVSSSLSSAYSMLNEITDENGNGMLSLSSIDTILTNNAFTSLRPYIDDMDKMQEALKGFIETQKDAYESLANQDLYESDYNKFKSEVDKKAESNSNFISDTIDEINDGINQIESTYNVDLTNWNNLSEDKKTLLGRV